MSGRSKRILGGVAFAAVWLVAIVALLLRSSPSAPPSPLPDPNGYDDFLKAGILIRGTLPAQREPTTEELEAYVATNQPALEGVRQGLARQSLVPPMDEGMIADHVEAMGRMKSLARLLSLEAELARRSNDWARLTSVSTNALSLALRLSQGGVIIDNMIAVAAEALALKSLTAAAQDLPASNAREAAGALAALDQGRTTFDRIRVNEEAYAQRSLKGYRKILWKLVLRNKLQAAITRTEAKHDARVGDTRRLALLLATAAYARDKGSPPETPAQLVPAYLPRVLEDPATRQPLDLPVVALRP